MANLFLHYAFDVWMAGEFPTVPFERYADDAVVHCVTERQARQVLAALSDRMAEAGLRLHPAKTRIVYCKDGLRRGSYEHKSFTFLGFTFRQRQMRDKIGRIRWSFRAAVSNDALKRLGEEVRSWRLHRRVDLTVEELAKRINPIVAGWMQYYGRFYRSALYPILMRINAYLVRWLRNKYRRFRATRKAITAFQRAAKRRPGMFAQWRWTSSPSLTW